MFTLTVFVFIACGGSASADSGKMRYLQLVKQPEGTVLLESSIMSGESFYIDYIHSSDLTPVHDIFQVDEKGNIVLIEEDYCWYGAGLEFHPRANAIISLEGEKTKVQLYRVFPHFLLRVGRVANHVFTYKNKQTPLKDLVPGGSLVWIRVISR